MAEDGNPQLLISAGGLCAPMGQMYCGEPGPTGGYSVGLTRVHCDGSSSSPVRDLLPAFTAARGGISIAAIADPQGYRRR